VIKSFFILQALVSIITATLVLVFVGQTQAISFAVGAAFAFTNTLVLAMIINRIFTKKSVALSFILIIFKYLIFGVVLYILITKKLVLVSWFMVGLSILVMSIIGLAVLHLQSVKKEK